MGKVMSDACIATLTRVGNFVPDESLSREAELEALKVAIGEIGK